MSKSGSGDTLMSKSSSSLLEELGIIPSPKKQLELGIERTAEQDRNMHLGGRSFYFFDFDDNVAFLTTPIVLFHKHSGEERGITSGEWAHENHRIGKEGPFEHYHVNFDDLQGTFRNFRDHVQEDLIRLGLKKQIFLHDIAEVLGLPDFQWKGPSWEQFFHATFNQRPVSVITARGHDPSTIQAGIRLLVEGGHLTKDPNYLSIFPVSHRGTRQVLGDKDLIEGTAELKQRAIRASVELAIQRYGYNPHHRFGMSDDDPRNIQLIIEEMTRLKAQYPELSFFMIETQKGEFVKHEITLSGLKGNRIEPSAAAGHQIKLF